MSPTSMSTDELIGQTFGAYTLTELLGTGGMASVYRGYQASIDRSVAVKVMPNLLVLDPTFLTRFTNEARTLAKLTHTAILTLYEFGEKDGVPYIVMPLMPGGSLEDRFANGPMSLNELLSIITPIADALDYAHNQGTVHRDIKPSNILFDHRGQAVLSDFGIAKTMEGGSNITSTMIVGTPDYMSPEQGRGQDLTRQTDQYSLGVVVYEALTGQKPFEANSLLGVIYMHVVEPPPPLRDIRSDIPQAVEMAVLQALAKKPADRFPTVNAFVRALANAAYLSRDFWLPGKPSKIKKSADPLSASSDPDATISLPKE